MSRGYGDDEDLYDGYGYGDGGFQHYDASFDAGYYADQDRRGYDEERRADRDRDRYSNVRDEWYSGMPSTNFGSHLKQEAHVAGEAEGVHTMDFAYSQVESSSSGNKGKEAEPSKSKSPDSKPKTCTCSSKRKKAGKCKCGAKEGKGGSSSKKSSSSKQ